MLQLDIAVTVRKPECSAGYASMNLHVIEGMNVTFDHELRYVSRVVKGESNLKTGYPCRFCPFWPSFPHLKYRRNR